MNLGSSGASGNYGNVLDGSLDEVVVIHRALSPTEIAAYYQSRRPYGRVLAPGAQDDFDDVRIGERSNLHQGYTIPHEVIGPRPHSDTPCPAEADDGTWADRDDLCGVEAYWRLDGAAEDVMGDHDGLNQGAVPTRGRFGPSSVALKFDGDSSYVDTTFGRRWSTNESFTIEAWARLEPGQSSVRIVASDLGPSGDVQLGLDDTRVFAVVRDQGEDGGSAYLNNVNYFDGTWHHFALVRDVGRDEVLLYVDGLERAAAVDESTTWIDNIARPFHIGAKNEGGASGFIFGSIDEVIVHNVAKSPDYLYRRANPGVPMVRFLVHTEPAPNDPEAEVPGFDFMEYTLHWGNSEAEHVPPVLTALDRETECVGLLSPCLGYAGWWKFDEGSGTVAADTSVNKHNGQLAGGENPPEWTSGSESTALRFDGDNSVDVGAIPDWSIGDDITIEADILRLDTSSIDTVVSNSADDSCPQFQFHFDWAVHPPALQQRFYYCDAGHAEGNRGRSRGSSPWTSRRSTCFQASTRFRAQC